MAISDEAITCELSALVSRGHERGLAIKIDKAF